MNVLASRPLLICFSHLRWDFVYQRPQHLMTRAARSYDVVFFEEPVFEKVESSFLRIKRHSPALKIVTPVLNTSEDARDGIRIQEILLRKLLESCDYDRSVAWYYTPMALRYSAFLQSDVCVYDCMDELAAFKNAPDELASLERLLFKRADLVFTGGQSLYEAKRGMHPRVFAFPSSVDAAHFEQARQDQRDPDDQAAIPRPRIGYFGVVDERLDVPLLACTAQALRDIHFIMIGPVVKIDPGILPTGSNIHWLGPKAYAELPAYMGKWDAGWMPFALNQATRFISPTKTPEFLAAGLPVVSTAIVDVVRTYAARGFVQIADADSMEFALRNALDRPNWNLGEVDGFLRNSSWDSTWMAMRSLMHSVPGRHASAADKVDTYV